jgi:hypothetical protein
LVKQTDLALNGNARLYPKHAATHLPPASRAPAVRQPCASLAPGVHQACASRAPAVCQPCASRALSVRHPCARRAPAERQPSAIRAPAERQPSTRRSCRRPVRRFCAACASGVTTAQTCVSSGAPAAKVRQTIRSLLRYIAARVTFPLYR